MIVVLVRENHRVDYSAGNGESLHDLSEPTGLGSAIDENSAATVLDEDRVALSDVENADHQRRVASRVA